MRLSIAFRCGTLQERHTWNTWIFQHFHEFVLLLLLCRLLLQAFSWGYRQRLRCRRRQRFDSEILKIIRRTYIWIINSWSQHRRHYQVNESSPTIRTDVNFTQHYNIRRTMTILLSATTTYKIPHQQAQNTLIYWVIRKMVTRKELELWNRLICVKTPKRSFRRIMKQARSYLRPKQLDWLRIKM